MDIDSLNKAVSIINDYWGVGVIVYGAGPELYKTAIRIGRRPYVAAWDSLSIIDLKSCKHSKITHSFSIRNILREEDIFDVWEFENSIYGDGCPDVDVLRSWWLRNKYGGYILYEIGASEKPRVVGAFGIWPLNTKPFDELMSGDKNESEIHFNSIKPYSTSDDYNDWYISGISLHKKYRKTHVASLFLGSALRMWQNTYNIKHNPMLRIVALAYMEEGEKLLKGFGFSQNQGLSSPDGWPVYLWTAQSQTRNFKRRVFDLNKGCKTCKQYCLKD